MEADKALHQKNKIIKASAKIFARKGFDNTTLDEIASEANIAKGTIYLYFKNKESLYLALIRKYIDSMQHIIKKEINKDTNFHDKLRHILKQQIEFYEQDKDIFKIGCFLESDVLIKTKRSKKVKELCLNLEAQLNKIMEIGVREKILKNIGEHRITLSYWGIVQMFAEEFIRNKDRVNKRLSSETEKILDIFLNGVGRY